MLKPLAPKFGSDLSIRLRDIAENQVSARLKPIVGIPLLGVATGEDDRDVSVRFRVLGGTSAQKSRFSRFFENFGNYHFSIFSK